jgi:type IV/VI secretion system ImpK/VasF family protein
MYRASAETLLAAAQIGVGAPLPAAEGLRQQMIGLLRQFVSNCREHGISDAETAEARYAIVAFVDEQVLRSNWQGRTEWMSQPLQLQFYRETTAGENFFGRMRALTARGSYRAALEAYYLCIALGFVGAPPGGGGARAARAYADGARPYLLDGLQPARFAPRAIPAERPAASGRDFPVILVAIIACALVCAVALAALHVLVGQAVRRAADPLAPTVSAPAASGRTR